MRNDRVLILVLHVGHDTKCFSPCVCSYFHRQLSDNFILSQKCQRLGCMSIKKRGRTVGSIENGASLRLIHNLSNCLTCFDKADVYTTTCRSIFIFALV